MNCWKILGIEPDADLKTIKLAYSKLLKKTRPDDDPEGFTALHTAYKSALAMAKRRAAVVSEAPRKKAASPEGRTRQETTQGLEKGSGVPVDDTTPESVDNSRNHNVLNVETLQAPEDNEHPVEAQGKVVKATQLEFSDQNAPVVETVHAPEHAEEDDDPTLDSEDDSFQLPEYERTLRKDYELIVANLEELIASPKRANKVAQWKSLESVPSMVDLNLSTQVSDLIFGAVSEANMESLEKGDLHIKQPVLRYLSDYFQWESNWQQFEDTYGVDQSNAIFKFVNTNQQNTRNTKLHYFARIMAFGVDLILGFICFYIATTIPAASFFKYIAVMYFLLLIPIMEASPLQASIGKKMFQLVVVDRSGLRLRWYHSFFRSYITYGCLLGIKLVVWINIYTSYRYRSLLQDLITRSDVAERE